MHADSTALPMSGEPLGRITFELYKNVVPRTAENFRQFCTGESRNSRGVPQGYKGSRLHRIVSFVCADSTKKESPLIYRPVAD